MLYIKQAVVVVDVMDMLNGDCGCGWQLSGRCHQRSHCISSSWEIFDNRTTHPHGNVQMSQFPLMSL